MIMGCGKYSEATWSGFLFGESSSRELLAHLDECPSCRSEVRSLQTTAAALRATPLSHPAVQEVFTSRVLASVEAAKRQQSATSQPRGLRRLSRWSLSSLGSGSLAAAACLLILLLFSGILGPDRLPPDDMQHIGENDPQMTLFGLPDDAGPGFSQLSMDPEGIVGSTFAADGDPTTRASHAVPLAVPDGVSRPITPAAPTTPAADFSEPRAQPIRESFGITMALP